MALNIRNPEAERLAEALAKLTGETKTEAVTLALRARLARLWRERAGRRLADELDEIALQCAGLPARDRRPADEISVTTRTNCRAGGDQHVRAACHPARRGCEAASDHVIPHDEAKPRWPVRAPRRDMVDRDGEIRYVFEGSEPVSRSRPR